MDTIKETSYSYGSEYQENQVKKYKNRANNHWKHRFELFSDLIAKAERKISNKNRSEVTVVDIGCSIGSFALEAGRMGFTSIGIDFDKEAIDIAKKIAEEENVDAKFICGDVSDKTEFNQKIDIAVCFDIFEHLHDDEMGSFLQSIKNNLSEKGVLIFHTFPTEYDYIFYGKLGYIPLVPFAIFSESFFRKLTKMYAAFIDSVLLLFKGKTQKERIKTFPHCNPTTLERLSDLLLRAGYNLDLIEVDQLYPFKKRIKRLFKKHPISYRNLYGMVSVKK